MKEICKNILCTGCSACLACCPKGCITMVPDSEGFYYPKVDESTCVECGECQKVCPANITERENTICEGLAVNAVDDRLRMNSSSGGAFSVLAESILEKGGAVAGVVFSEDFKTAYHEITTSKTNLEKMRGSKYFQSEPNDVFPRIKDLLETGMPVLFSGTPCQVEGLLSFLEKPYEKLVCVDVICHGIPSSLAWEKYISGFQNPKTVSFRNKVNGWKNYSVQIRTVDNEYLSKGKENVYMQLFLKDVCLRPSCYDCRMKSMTCRSDLTIGDLWGSENIVPELDDDKGTSLVLVHTQKGKELLNFASANIIQKQVPVAEAVRYNAAIVKGAKRPKLRDSFYFDVQKMPFEKLGKKYLRPAVKERLKMFLKRVGLLEPAKKIKHSFK